MPVLTTLQWGERAGLLPLVTRIKTFVTVDVPWDQRPRLPVKSTKTIANPHLPDEQYRQLDLFHKTLGRKL